MKAELTVERIVNEMLKLELIDPDNSDSVAFYFFLAYGAGYDNGRMQKTKRRKVIQLSLEGKPLRIFDSVTLAGRAMKVDNTAISFAAKVDGRTCQGFRWKYLDKCQEHEKHGANP